MISPTVDAEDPREDNVAAPGRPDGAPDEIRASSGAWEDDGGTPAAGMSLEGSSSQVEWAERIKMRVGAEFDRVAKAFYDVARKQDAAGRASTHAVVAVVEDIRTEVMGNQRAGYFIHDWQDISDQVRQMVFADPRYQSIKAGRKSRGV